MERTLHTGAHTEHRLIQGRFDNRGGGPGGGGGSSGRTEKPRKVRRGIRLGAEPADLEASWAAQRWLRLVDAAASADAILNGLEYARLGQVRHVGFDPGHVGGLVQGRVYRAYSASLQFTRFAPEQWDKAVEAMVDQARYAAKLLAGELPPNIEDVFGPLGLHLFPATPQEVTTSCTCSEPQPWCKHVCCLAYLLAERLSHDTMLVFSLRGLPGEELIERLRQRRAVTGSTQGATPVYVPRVPGVAEIVQPPLEQTLDSFWDAPPGLDRLDLPVEPPAVSHPLLRRLGPSPFAAGGFPLVGLLATCYEQISEAVLAEEEGTSSEAPAEDGPAASTEDPDAPPPPQEPDGDSEA
jgi:uncharacterized Zn finger protein